LEDDKNDNCKTSGKMSDAPASDAILQRVTEGLAAVPGVAAVSLGGSRARGTATPSSDVDIGLYYERRFEPDVACLRELANKLADDPAAAVVTEIGGWGPWIVGGAWLTIGGRKVDLLYRCLESVEDVIHACLCGRVTMDYQPGHPHGFCSAIWMGEVALCRPLRDPEGRLAALKAMTRPYPEPLREALLRRFLWEVLFSIENGELAVARGDPTHVAGCAYRAMACLSQSLFALNRRYLINEKGAPAEAARFPITIPGLAERVSGVWRGIGAGTFQEALDRLRALDQDLKAVAATESFL
jgi:predicted nucleotidyltransferase